MISKRYRFRKNSFLAALTACAAPGLVAGMAILAPTLSGCGSSGGDIATTNVVQTSGTFFGTRTAVGNGSVRSFVTLSETGVPTAYGVRVTEGALSGVPDSPPPYYAAEFLPPLPPQAAATPIRDISFYYTQGHPPTGIYDPPHYHVAFAVESSAERDQIDVNDTSSFAPVDPQFVPPNHVPFPQVLPRLGVVYFDLATPEFNGGEFSSEFDYSYYQGKLVSLNFTIPQRDLLAHRNVVKPIIQPVRFQKSGYYPAQYRVSYDAASREFTISLEGLTQR